MSSNFFESYKSSHEVEGPSDRNFGFTVGGIFLALGLLKIVLGAGPGPFAIAFTVIGALLLLGALIRSPLLSPLNRAWMKLGLLLFRIVNPIVMFLIFALTVVPTGLVMRLRGKDLLGVKRDQSVSSYWIQRPRGEPDPKSMINQF